MVSAAEKLLKDFDRLQSVIISKLSALEQACNLGTTLDVDDRVLEDINKEFGELENALESGTVAAEEEEIPHIRRDALRSLVCIKEECVRMRMRFKVLTTKFHSLAIQQEKNNRSKLFSNSTTCMNDNSDMSTNMNNSRKMMEKAKIVDTSRDVTSSLRRMKKHIVNELNRIDYAEEILAGDSDMIAQTNAQAEKYSEGTDTATRTLKSIDFKQRKSAFLGKIGFLIFCCVLAWTVFKRIPPSLTNPIISLFTYAANSLFQLFSEDNLENDNIMVNKEEL